MKQYYDDHCIICFMGEHWLITSLRPGRMNIARYIDENTIQQGSIDISSIDWPEYCNRAVKVLQERYKKEPQPNE